MDHQEDDDVSAVQSSIYIDAKEPRFTDVPLWADGYLSDDFDELHAWLGISRELYDDLVTWQRDYAAVDEGPTPARRDPSLHARRAELEHRLAAQLPPHLQVRRHRAKLSPRNAAG